MSNTKTIMGQASNQYVTPTDITDVFSTYLYDGSSSAQTITNGIDLAGEGGLVWMKNRTSGSYSHALQHTTIADGGYLSSNTTVAFQAAANNGISAFNSNGFTFDTGNWEEFNNSAHDYASWTFRKAPKFFDVVSGLTSDGSGNLPQFNHNLGSTPGCVIMKATDSGSNWVVFHKGLSASGANQYIQLNNTSAATSATGFGIATDTTFEVGAGSALVPSVTYVAYLFAHNNSDGGFGPNGDQDIIKCGSYTGNGSDTGPVIDLGFEPQWLLVKRASGGTGEWALIDSMRGFTADGSDAVLKADATDAEGNQLWVSPNATGFKLRATSSAVNASGSTYIYMAIRRGPLASPTAGTEVFAVDTGTGASDKPKYISNFPVDMAIITSITASEDNYNSSRLSQERYLVTNTSAAESGSINFSLDYNDGWFGAGGTNRVSWMWKRAPSFFDVVTYAGSSSAGTLDVKHNLAAKPELIIAKRRNSVNAWRAITSITASNFLTAGTISTSGLSTQTYSSTSYLPSEPTDTSLIVNTDTGIGSLGNYTAYLFATLAGVSKVSSYTGNGSSQTIDCGFTTGARFILIKRTGDSGVATGNDWYVWDTARGVVTGNDPHLSLNTTAAQVSDDSIDPDSSGFIVNQVGDASINASGAVYIFYAIA